MRFAVLLAACLAVLACQRETPDVSQSGPSQSTTVAGDTAGTLQPKIDPTMPAEKDEPASRGTPAPPTQEVHLIEYAIHMPSTVPAGTIAFNVENGGKEQHGFEIEGQGIEEKTQTLNRGDSATLTVNLKPGTYTVYCPVKDHAKKGMKTTITAR